MNNLGGTGGGTLHFFLIPVIIGAIILMYRNGNRIYARLKNRDQLARMPLEVSPDKFRERFKRKIGTRKDYFQAELFSEARFYIQYIAPHTSPHGGWISLRGIIEENEILYDVSRRPIYVGEEVERDRLIDKLAELCAGDGAEETEEP